MIRARSAIRAVAGCPLWKLPQTPALSLLPTFLSTTTNPKMTSRTSYPAFNADTKLSAYAAGPFPVVPRSNGIAKVTAGSARDGTTRIQIVTKDDVKAAFTDSKLHAADAEEDSVAVSYEKAGDAEYRVLRAVAGKKITVGSVRKAVVAAITKAKSLKVKDVDLVLPRSGDAALDKKIASAAVQAAALVNYQFDRYLTTESKIPSFVENINVVADAAVHEDIKQAAVLAECTILARDLANERADEMHPERLQHVAESIAREAGMKVHTVIGDALVSQGLHLLHAVGQAARFAPRYVELFHAGDPAHPEDVIAIVGKGVSFDSGGLNIKGTGFMEDMHMDMGGSAAVLGAALAAGRLGIKRNIVFVVGAVENAIDALAYKPHAIIRSHKGLTVEIGNTDAEGRLVLADALSLVQERHKPHTIIDLATLTGACVIALGEPLAGAFTNSKALREGLLAAGDARYERCWPMPILSEHRAELTGTPFADVKSTGEGRYGGACTAAAFLEMFIGNKEASYKPAWCHLDIAGPGMFSKDRGHFKRGGTGFGVQLLAEYLLNAAAGAPEVNEESD